MKSKSLIKSLCDRKIIGLEGETLYSTREGHNGIVVCQHQGMPEVRIVLIEEPNGFLTLWNLEARIERRTFQIARNTCGEALHHELQLLSAKQKRS